MQAYRLILSPQTAFGTPLAGDTLFGQICWGIVEQYGETTLEGCLQGYLSDNPFLVASDAFPAGFLPLPALPSAYWHSGNETDRKKLKKRQWLPESALNLPSRDWQNAAKGNTDIDEQLISRHNRPHNSLNRQTHTTGAGGPFAPYESDQIWYAADSQWQIYLLLDEGRLNAAQLQQVLNNIGLSGYGRDASAGLGKFELISMARTDLLQNRHGNAVLSLAASCPQGLDYDAGHSYYQVQTRFGRHGNIQATAGRPFKQPVLMAQAGAVFSGVAAGSRYIGQGVGGISAGQPQAVQQGYAPVLAFDLDIAAL
ncbi:MAG: hypothetical protein Q4G28_00700 [Neisseria sp.]|nr:hypothetical protein [Neisseria sp.]